MTNEQNIYKLIEKFESLQNLEDMFFYAPPIDEFEFVVVCDDNRTFMKIMVSNKILKSENYMIFNFLNNKFVVESNGKHPSSFVAEIKNAINNSID